MLKKTISIALAISMFAVAFAALGVNAAAGPTGEISAKDSKGITQEIFFPGEKVYFMLEYKFDGAYAYGDFTVNLIDTGGDQVGGSVSIYTNGQGADVGRNTSWLPLGSGIGPLIPWGQAPGTYSLQAILVNTSDILCSDQIEIKNPAITVTPKQDIYAPGQTVNIKVTSTWDRLALSGTIPWWAPVVWNPEVNITIGFKDNDDKNKGLGGNITLGSNQRFNDTYEWSTSWMIPENMTGLFPIYVNSSHNDLPITTWWMGGDLAADPFWINIEYFTFEVSTDKQIYLPGEEMVVSFVGRSVPNNTIIPITLDYEMWYQDAQTGDFNWKNYSGTTSLASSPSNVTLPAQANILQWDPRNIWVNATAHWGDRTYNIAFNPTMAIRLGSLSTTISTDTGTYGPGEKILVTVDVRVNDPWGSAPVSGAMVDVKLYDDKGALVPALGLTNLLTDLNGKIKGTIDIPLENMTFANGYMLVASASKLILSAVNHCIINIQDNPAVQLLVDKAVYIGGDDINIAVKIWRDGVATTPDSILYWLETCPDVFFATNVHTFPVMNMVNMTANVTAPSDMEGFGRIRITPTVDGKIWGDYVSSTFTITQNDLTVDVQVDKAVYIGGDDINIAVKIWRDGVATTPDNISYWLETCQDGLFATNVHTFPVMNMVNITANVTVVTANVTAPSDIEGFGRILITPTVDGKIYGEKIWGVPYRSDIFTITQDDLIVKVLVDKTVYIGGDDISVVIKIWRDGVATTPDNISYWLETCPDNSFATNVHTFPVMTMVGMTANVTAPSDMEGFGRISVSPTVDGKIYGEKIWGDPYRSVVFAIEPLILTLGVSKMNYYAGDTITFTVKVVGESIAYAMTYEIENSELSPVANGVVTLDTDGKYVFTLEIPEVNPSSSYTATVIADNGDGSVLRAEQTVDWVNAYLLDVKITTGPASTTGSYAPGQTIWLSFVVTKMSSDLPDLPVVTAYVELYNLFGGTVAYGEEMSFTDMKGEVSITIPNEAPNGIFYFVDVSVWDSGNVWSDDQSYQISVNGNEAGWAASWGGMSASDLLTTILMVAVIVMLVFMMMKKGGGAVAPAEPKAPKEAKKKKEETYQPKSSVKCPSCGVMVEVATSKRPIEVMCPKCGTSQMVN